MTHISSWPKEGHDKPEYWVRSATILVSRDLKLQIRKMRTW